MLGLLLTVFLLTTLLTAAGCGGGRLPLNGDAHAVSAQGTAPCNYVQPGASSSLRTFAQILLLIPTSVMALATLATYASLLAPVLLFASSTPPRFDPPPRPL